MVTIIPEASSSVVALSYKAISGWFTLRPRRKHKIKFTTWLTKFDQFVGVVAAARLARFKTLNVHFPSFP